MSRQWLESLIALYGCKYVGGRAESAARVKQGTTSRPTMAQAHAELDSDKDGRVEYPGSGAHAQHATHDGSGAPYMPHVALTQEELERLHPSLVP